MKRRTMPTYEYACESCGYEFEEFQSITAPPLKKCPRCARRALRRLIGAGGGVIFKGNGFYQTDYRTDSSGSNGDSKKTNGKKEKAAAKAPSTKATAKAADSLKVD
jgi:putative FmdB family regulatory protein